MLTLLATATYFSEFVNMRNLGLLVLLFVYCLISQVNSQGNDTNTTTTAAKSLEDRKSGLAFLTQVLNLTQYDNNSAITVHNSAGVPLAAADDPDKIAPFDLLSDADKRSQFLAELPTPGSSGSYATSNSYQQYGKVITYAVSLSYAPLQTGAPIAAKLEDTAAPDTTPQQQSDVEDKAKKQWGLLADQPWSPNAWNGHSYYYPYYYIPGKPAFYFPPVGH